jgi:NAD(P)-dependent dehydrogenase (short-subunit alcohol dehydrogenase family)
VELPVGWDDAAAKRILDTTPLGRLGRVDDVVNAVLFLLESDFITGSTLVVDGGRRVR